MSFSLPLAPILMWRTLFATLALAGTVQAAELAPLQGPLPQSRAEVLALAQRVADRQGADLAAGWLPPQASRETARRDGWVQAALMVGLAELAERSREPRYRQLLLARAEANRWQLGPWLPFADDHAIGQLYLWAATQGQGPAALQPMRESFDRILAAPPRVALRYLEEHEREGGTGCLERWCWSDAIFMAPPVWLGLSQATGDARYARFAAQELSATLDYLFDPTEDLFFRDSRFFDRRDARGRKLFWSRGNGWVVSGLVRMIPLLAADDPLRARLVTLLRRMAGRLLALQRADGSWPPSLLDGPHGGLPESSGTAFFVHGLATGVREGWLDAPTHLPAVRRGWAALVRSVQPDDRLGWVQAVGDRPEQVGPQDTQLYGVGAFLLAASAVADLAPAAR